MKKNQTVKVAVVTFRHPLTQEIVQVHLKREPATKKTFAKQLELFLGFKIWNESLVIYFNNSLRDVKKALKEQNIYTQNIYSFKFYNDELFKD